MPLWAIAPAKITSYLLDENHPRGGSKARFFIKHGFDPARPEELAAALLDHPALAAETATVPTRFGVKRTFTGPLLTPNGGRPTVMTIWQEGPADDTSALALLVTAYPA